jgi:putative sterol carrier protein
MGDNGSIAGQTTGVIRYLSLEWIDALSGLVEQSTAMATAAEEQQIGVTQLVTDGPEGNVVYHLQVGDGRATFGAGAAHPEDVRMEQSWATACAVSQGRLNAQEAFITGKILLTGDRLKLLSAQPVFVALDSVFNELRERTEYV